MPASLRGLHVPTQAGVRRRGRCGLYLLSGESIEVARRRAGSSRRMPRLSSIAGQCRRRLWRPARLAQQPHGHLLRPRCLGCARCIGFAPGRSASRTEAAPTCARRFQGVFDSARSARLRQPGRSGRSGPIASHSPLGREERQGPDGSPGPRPSPIGCECRSNSSRQTRNTALGSTCRASGRIATPATSSGRPMAASARR